MKKLLGFLFALILFGCNEAKKSNAELKTQPNLETLEKTIKKKAPYTIDFDSTQVSEYTIESRDEVKSKALDQKLSDYSTAELKALPEFKRLNLGIIVPFDISRESLRNTMKAIVYKESHANKDIDEIMIFAYDDKKDLINGGGIYTFGKLIWGPKGETGAVTPKIAAENIRESYRFTINIKDRVGKIKKSDVPTKRELEIYYEIISEKYIGMEEGKLNALVMKKFNISTEKELNAIWAKVAAYKF